MDSFKPGPNSLSNLEYTPRFYCLLCNSDLPATCLSEHKAGGGVIRELICRNCHSMERVGIRLAEDYSDWLLFQIEDPTPTSKAKIDASEDRQN